MNAIKALTNQALSIFALAATTAVVPAWSAGGERVCAMDRDVTSVVGGGSPQFAEGGCGVEVKVRAAAQPRDVVSVSGRGTYVPVTSGEPGSVLSSRSLSGRASVATIHGHGTSYPARIESADAVAIRE